MAKIIRPEQELNTEFARAIIGGAASVEVEWNLIDEAGRTVDADTKGHEVADQPPEVQAAVATIMAWALGVAGAAAGTKEAARTAELTAAVAAKAAIEGGSK